jgi:beta-aspartyl-peptidase (threonine type)
MSHLPSIALHGGAGNLARYAGTGRLEEAENVLGPLVDHIYTMLQQGASAVDAVTEAVVRMEDTGLFHAGRGSAPNQRGYVELDASIMTGHNLEAGAVALVQRVKNPIKLARHVMEHTSMVLLGGAEADALAELQNFEMVDASYFQPCDMIGGAIVGHPPSPSTGTVGAVARDTLGNVAAATSTGGTLRKTAGRIGDAPLIGSGTYAKNNVGAVSCTGIGEYFIRNAAAYAVISRMELLGESVGSAAGTVMQHIHDLGGEGGLIAIGPRGEVSMPFNTSGMYRASIDAWGKRTVGVL